MPTKRKLLISQSEEPKQTEVFETKEPPIRIEKLEKLKNTLRRKRREIRQQTEENASIGSDSSDSTPDCPKVTNMESDHDRLSNIYTGLADDQENTEVKKPHFGNLFSNMLGNKNRGHVNPAFSRDDDDSDDDAYCDSQSSSRGSYSGSDSDSDSRSYRPERSRSPSPVANGHLGRDIKVDFRSLKEKKHPPPQQAKPKQKRSWDRFISTPKEKVYNVDKPFWEKVFVVTKIVVVIVLFLLTLGTAVISKICFIMISTNMLVPNGTTLSGLKTLNGTLSYKNVVPGTTNVQWIWAMISLVGAPYVFTFCRNFWRIWIQLQSRGSPSWSTILLVLLIETIHSVGLMLTVFVVVPNMDPISGLLITLTIGVVPGFLKFVYPTTDKSDALHNNSSSVGHLFGRIVSLVGSVGQLAALALWCYHLYIMLNSSLNNIPYLICMIIAPIMTSIYWWENFVHEGRKNSSGLPLLARHIRKSRTKLTFYASILKMILTLVIPIGLFGASCDDGTNCINTLYLKHDAAKLNTDIINTRLVYKNEFRKCNDYMPIMIAVVGIICNAACFKVGKMGCKIMAQVVDYSLPLALSTPAAVGIVLGMYSGFITTSGTGCAIPFPVWASGNSDDYFDSFSKGYKYWLNILAGLSGFMSLLLITNHIWFPGKERLQRTDRLFVQPLFCGVMFDLSMMLNRRRIDRKNVSDTVKTKVKEQRAYEDENIDLQKKEVFSTPDTPIIYMCATMWHETENEMTQLLKSVFRMDEDQCIRKHAQFVLNRRDPDYYEFEAHIFFDDAFEKHRDDEYNYSVNDYVKLLIKTVEFSASAINGANYKIRPPIKTGTPYGGRLVWNLPGGNKLIAHLKDKTIIRHRKRWSQVMYMYYFLAYQLFKEDGWQEADRKRKKALSKRATNTFLLALDGDVDFYPSAVQLLVDRMKKNPDVGAACGRIHPIGNGAMVWYQKFEYAISHWLQKAAEDKLGCVLCSPGCFSLFRGSALMDDNVMNRYTTPPSEPRHHVQYDQGEDRWLCTLLLQQGHRVEYCAASDALTYAPEGFYEFFKQRRRWMPSTMANIMDLLTDWKNVTEKNPEISLLYVCYQGLLMVSSILTPGTIFLMILGAITMAYPAIDLWWALVINILPIAVMILLCFTANDQKQLTYAAVLSTAYSLIMMIVIVGLLVQAAKFGICSVTTVFITFVGGVFVLSALIHPQEFWCIIHGFLYFLSIPSMSMILMIYSLGNLHVVTWGTRENKAAEVAEKEQKKKEKLPGFLGKFGRFLPSFGFGNASHPEDNALRAILDRLEGIEGQMQRMSEHGSRFSDFNSLRVSPAQSTSSPYIAGEGNNEKFSQINDFTGGDITKENPAFKADKDSPRDRLIDPYWMKEDKDLSQFKEDRLEKDEVQFWEELIDEYLKPFDANPEKQKVMAAELIELRNKVCLIFILINSLFIIIVFTLQQVVATGGSLSILLPCADPDADRETRIGQSIEPISVAFTLVFGILLFVQFICMLMHRQATLLHICASTEIFKKKRKVQLPGQEETGEEDSRQEFSYDQVYEMVRDMQKDQDADSLSVASETSSAMSDVDEEEFDQRKKEEAKARWKRIAKARKKVTHNTFHANFQKNMQTLQRVVSERNAEDGDNEEDKDLTAKRIKKATNFNRFRNQSLHVLATMTRDKSMREQLAHKKVQRGIKNFQLIANKAKGVRKISEAVKVLRAQQARDEIRDEIKSGELEMKRRTEASVAEEDEIEETDAMEMMDSALKEKSAAENSAEGSPRENQDDSGNSRQLNEDEFKIHIPKVENDEWPEEGVYVNQNFENENAAYGDMKTLDTFF